MRELVILLITTVVIVYLIFRISKRGISKKYERKSSTQGRPKSAWNSLDKGIDPTQ